MSALQKKCDMCGDKNNGFRIRTCNGCGVSVHMECYGLIYDDPNGFCCWACQAKGKLIQTEGRNADGSRMKILQAERPRRCEFCNIETGNHAMHPLFDNEGPKGRHMHTNDPQPRLLWAHSICVFWLSVRGYYFGCCRTGH
jgi:hypothetical protein